MAYYSPQLIITDGTAENTVDLLNTVAGYILCDWSPVRPGLQYDYHTDVTSGLRRPAGVRFDTPIDTFTVSCRDTTVGKAIAHERKLTRLLRNAVRFWTNTNQVERPYYIAARAKDESTTRYALILSTSLHGSGNPYAQPFATNSKNKATSNLSFNIEHDLWSLDPPFTTRNGSVLSSIDSPYTSSQNIGYHPDNLYSGESIGDSSNWNSSGSTGFAAAANHGAVTEFSAIVRGSGSLDVLNTALSAPDIFNSTTDYTYFFVDAASSHIFNNIVLVPASVTSSSNGTFTAQYYSASGWKDLAIRDTSYGMKKPGIISWLNPEDQVTTSVLGQSNSWVVRVKRTGGDANSTRAQVLPYSVGWGHIEIPDDAKGDAGVRLDLRMPVAVWTDDDRGAGVHYEINNPPNRMLIGGTRKELISYISPQYNDAPPYDTDAVFIQPQTAQSFTTGFAASKSSPYGRVAYGHTTPNAIDVLGSFKTAAVVQFRNTGTGMYAGNFRALFRMRPSAYGGSDALTSRDNLTISMMARIGYRSGDEDAVTGIDDSASSVEWVQSGPVQTILNPRTRTYVYDMGIISLGDPKYIGQGAVDMYQTMDFRVAYDASGGAGIRYNVVDLILIPVDEFFMDVRIPRAADSSFTASKLQDTIINSASSLGTLNGHVAIFDGSYFDRNQRKHSSVSFPVGAPLWLDGDGSTYLHFFSYFDSGPDLYRRLESSPSDAFAIDIATVPLYLSAVGDTL